VRTRDLELDKPPGLAEAVDWVSALAALGVGHLDRGLVERTMGSIIKTPDDLSVVRDAIATEQLPVMV